MNTLKIIKSIGMEQASSYTDYDGARIWPDL